MCVCLGGRGEAASSAAAATAAVSAKLSGIPAEEEAAADASSSALDVAAFAWPALAFCTAVRGCRAVDALAGGRPDEFEFFLGLPALGFGKKNESIPLQKPPRFASPGFANVGLSFGMESCQFI